MARADAGCAARDDRDLAGEARVRSLRCGASRHAAASATQAWRWRPSCSIAISTTSPRLQVGEPAGQRDALRRSGEDHVARLEDDVLAQVGDDLVDVEDHVRRPRVLPRLAVDEALQCAGPSGSTLSAVTSQGPSGQKPGAPLPFDHCPPERCELPRALGEVVGDGVPRDVRARLLLRGEPPGARADDDGELRLPVDVVGCPRAARARRPARPRCSRA